MLWEQFAELCRDWMRRLPPEEAHAALKALLKLWLADPTEARMDEAIALALAEPGPASTVKAPAPAPEASGAVSPHLNAANKPTKRKALDGKEAGRAPRRDWRGRPSKRAQALVREQLKHGPKPAAQVEAAAQAADIPERVLIAAASALGVRTQRGQWWLPG